MYICIMLWDSWDLEMSNRKIIVALMLLISLQYCSKNVSWEREELIRNPEPFYFRGIEILDSQITSQFACKIGAFFVAQTIYGQNGLSSKGPYKLNINSQFSECQNVYITAIEIYLDEKGTQAIYQSLDTNTLSANDDSSYYSYFSEESIDISAGENLFLVIRVSDENANSNEFVFNFYAEKSSGQTDIPLITT